MRPEQHPSWDKIVRATHLRGRGATQKETADALNVSRRSIIRWESRPELWRAAQAEAENPHPEGDGVGDSEGDTGDDVTDPVALPARAEPGGTAPTKPIPATETCNARTRKDGTPCQREAGWGTDHVGIGRCKLHGGAASTANLKHGRYSTVRHEQLRELIAEMEADPDPLNAIPELATARALLKGWLDDYQDLVDALMAWNAAEERDAALEDRKPRPARIPEVKDALPLISEISKAVKRVQDARNANAISRPELHRLMGEMGRVVAHHCDEATAQAVRDDWLTIRL